MGGVIGLILPSHPGGPKAYDPNAVPARLMDNVRSGYASLHPWSESPAQVQQWIHDAFLRRTSHYHLRDLSKPLRRRNSKP